MVPWEFLPTPKVINTWALGNLTRSMGKELRHGRRASLGTKARMLKASEKDMEYIVSMIK